MNCDAWVFCDCYEQGRTRRPARPEWQVYVHEDGCRESRAAELPHLAAFGHWTETACDHDYGILLHRRLGVLADLLTQLASLDPRLPRLTALLSRLADAPELKVSGEELGHLDEEIRDTLSRLTGPSPVDHLLTSLLDLVTPARALGKPLVVQGG